MGRAISMKILIGEANLLQKERRISMKEGIPPTGNKIKRRRAVGNFREDKGFS